MTVSTPRSPHRRACSRPATWRVRPLVWALAVIGSSAAAQGLPTGFNPISGSVNAPSISGNDMTVRQNSDRAIVQWNTFSIGAGHSVTFNQPGASSIILNRVTGGEMSTIAGQLGANGRIFLINPSGVLFGGGSQVSTGGLVASTLNISNEDFNAGRFTFERPDANVAGIINEGSLTSAGGTIALMAAAVENRGSIQADGGTAALVSARKVSLDFAGDGLTTFRIDADTRATSASVTQTAAGLLKADGGRVAVLADSTQIAQQVVNLDGVARARSLVSRNGEILLGATGNDMAVSGQVDATGAGAGRRGGSVQVDAAGVRLGPDASLDASGVAGGGTVGVTATRDITLDTNAAVRASATQGGDGGSVTLSSEGGQHVAGTIEANAAGAGKGGGIDTSAYVIEVGEAKVSAAGAGGGANGSWRIASSIDMTVTPETPPPRVGSEVSVSEGESLVSDKAVGGALGRSTDVTLASVGTPVGDGRLRSGGVTFADGAQVVKDAGGDATLTVNSVRHIDMNQDSRIASSSGALNVDFNADADGSVIDRSESSFSMVESGGAILLNGATIESNGGNIRFYGQSDAAGGHALGGQAFYGGMSITTPDGISMVESTVSTCGLGDCAASAGAITMRGQAVTMQGSDGWVGGTGIAVVGTSLSAGRGGLTLEGQGGEGAAGVYASGSSSDFPLLPSMRSGGDVRIVGTGTDSTRTSGLIESTIRSGVEMFDANVVAAGDVTIDGTGSDLSVLRDSEDFRKALGSDYLPSVGGVSLYTTDVTAGKGRRIDIAGTAGSAGMFLGEGYEFVEPNGVEIGGAPFPALAAADIGPFAVGDQPTRITAEGGTIVVRGRDSDVGIQGGQYGVILDASSPDAAGGSIDVTGRTVAVIGDVTLDAQGTNGGAITVSGTGVTAVDDATLLRSNATGADGNGGDVRVFGEQGLLAYGTIEARGTGRGRGGQVDTSGATFDLRGITVDASSGEGGTAGTWTIDPYNVRIIHDNTSGSVSFPYDAPADSVVQDADINKALDSGTSVSISTGTGGTPGVGAITIESGVDIQRTTGTATLDFTLNAHTGIAGDNFTIASSSGALNVALNVDADGTQPNTGYITLNNASINTNGGNVSFYGQSDAANGAASSEKLPPIGLSNVSIDTRAGQADTGAGGTVAMRAEGIDTDAILFDNVTIQSSTGDVTLRGNSQALGQGVRFSGDDSFGGTRITTTTGNVSVLGIGADNDGVVMTSSVIRTQDGTIDVRGRASGATTTSSGVVLEGASLVAEGTGRVQVTGESQGGGSGIDFQGGTFDSAYAVDGGNQAVVLRADNDGSGDAISLNAPVRSGSLIDLRPGGVDAAGNIVEHPGTAISLGGTTDTGFSLSASDLANLEAPELVVGSDIQSGDITVEGAVTTTSNLTLQTPAGGAIALDGAVQAARLGLIAGGDVTQTAALTATSLLARSATGGVYLDNAANSVATVAGGAAADFVYANAGALSIGSAQATGIASATDAPQTLTADGVAADRVIVRTASGDLTANQDVTGQTAATLQADAGALNLQADMAADTIGLLASGAVSQVAAATITGDALLARSTGGSVTLTNGANAVATLAGSAAGDFRYIDADGLAIGSVDAAGPVTPLASASGVTAATTQIQTRSGDLAVNAATTGSTALGLEAVAGNVAVNAGLQGATVALQASGDVTQSGTAGIAGNALLARSTGGDVVLASTANDVATLAGSAAGEFRYTDANALSVGSVNATLMTAAGAAQPAAAAGVAAQSAIVQAVAGPLNLDAASTATDGFTLQADGGAVNVNAALQAGTVALLAAGDVGQATGGAITGTNLLARSTNGNVALLDAGNAGNAVDTLAGNAAGDFRYADADGLAIGSVTAANHSAAGAAQTTTGTGVAANATQVQARSGNLAVDAATAGTATLGLEAVAGNVAVNANLQGGSVALRAAGDIEQTGASGIAARSLLAQAGGGDVVLASATNDVDTVAGSATGAFRYTDANALSVGSVNATLMDATGAPQAATATGIAAESAIVQTVAGTLNLDAVSNASNGFTLQSDGGAVNVNAALQAATLALLADGNVTQSAAGTLTATSLLAQSAAGSVALAQAANTVDTFSGQAGTTLAYTDINALTIGSVTANRAGAAGSVAGLTAAGIDADASTVRTQSGDLTLAAPVTGGTADLVAAARFQNPSNAAIGTSGAWRVWADTWEGENRGGLSGSGTLPNLYNRSFGTASVTDPDNHFIYRQQPIVTITLDSAERPSGLPNPPLGYTLSGLILGDSGAGITGTAGTDATSASPAGTYAVTATTPFVSAEGYAVNVVPGVLTVRNYIVPVSVDVLRELPTTYTYDRNIAPVGMCFATGPLDGDRAEQTGDVLAREWSRVRTRPNLTNCVSVDRSNACSNF